MFFSLYCKIDLGEPWAWEIWRMDQLSAPVGPSGRSILLGSLYFPANRGSKYQMRYGDDLDCSILSIYKCYTHPSFWCNSLILLQLWLLTYPIQCSLISFLNRVNAAKISKHCLLVAAILKCIQIAIFQELRNDEHCTRRVDISTTYFWTPWRKWVHLQLCANDMVVK